jgi:hypothetical protein
MVVPLILFLISAAISAYAAVTPGWGDFALIAGLMAVASLILLLIRPRGERAARDPRQVIVDGSNVMHWRDNTPDLATLKAVIARLTALGYHPGVVFDANAGYLVAGGFRNDLAFSKLLGLPRDHILVVPKGTTADEYILAFAKQSGAPIISNDRYRDWEAQHPEIRQPGRLVRGGWVDGGPWVDMDAFAERHAAA